MCVCVVAELAPQKSSYFLYFLHQFYFSRVCAGESLNAAVGCRKCDSVARLICVSLSVKLVLFICEVCSVVLET